MDALLVSQLLSRAFCIKKQNNENPAAKLRRWPKGRSLNMILVLFRTRKDFESSAVPTTCSVNATVGC